MKLYPELKVLDRLHLLVVRVVEIRLHGPNVEMTHERLNSSKAIPFMTKEKINQAHFRPYYTKMF